MTDLTPTALFDTNLAMPTQCCEVDRCCCMPGSKSVRHTTMPLAGRAVLLEKTNLFVWGIVLGVFETALVK